MNKRNLMAMLLTGLICQGMSVRIYNYNVGGMEQDNIKSLVAQEIENKAKLAESQRYDLSDLASGYKWHMAGTAVVGSYFYVLYKLMKANKMLSDSNGWHAWKAELSLENLFDIPTEKLTEQLIKDIQSKYYNELNPGFVVPLSKFAVDLQKETNQLNEYLRLVKLLKSIYIDPIFPVGQEALAKDRLQKLNYINSLFKHWNSTFKKKTISRLCQDCTD